MFAKLRANAFIIGAVVLLGISNVISFVATRPPEPTGTQSLHMDYVTDVSDPRRLVGLADNVFVGRVVEQVGTKRLDSVPETQFRVEVLESIKGSLAGAVIVNQQGGYDGKLLVLMGEDKMLEPGRTYLLATRYHADENFHTLVPAYGDVPLLEPQQHAQVVGAFKMATRQQVPFRLDE